MTVPLWWIGVDLGQARDYSAITAMRITPTRRLIEDDSGIRQIQTTPLRIDLVHCERLPLGTPYPAVVERVHEIQRQIAHPSALVVDATGVGRPVLDMMTERGLNPIGINITGGSNVTVPEDGYRVSIFGVPKRDVVAVLVVALQNHRLRIASGLPFAADLVHELQNFKVSISASGHDSYAAWREADHDDLVLALGVAAWLADYHYANPGPADYVVEYEDDGWMPDLISPY